MSLGLAPLAVMLLLGQTNVAADIAAGDKEFELPAVFAKRVPETVEDLKAIETHVRLLTKKVLPATVGIRIGQSSGSGVIIDAEGHVLTAGHVSGEANRDCTIILADGKKLKGKTLGANRSIDSGMIKITEKGEFPYLMMAKPASLKRGHWCLAIGHPGGFQTGRSPVVRVGRVLDVNANFLRTDCALVGGDSGGPLVDMNGQVIGIHSRIGGSITANIHVPVDTYRDTWERLAKAEIWGNNLFGGASDAYLGIQIDSESKTCKIQVVTPKSPAEKAGLQVDDVILAFDGQQVKSADEFLKIIRGKRPGNAVSFDVRRGETTIQVRVVLGKRPTG